MIGCDYIVVPLRRTDPFDEFQKLPLYSTCSINRCTFCYSTGWARCSKKLETSMTTAAKLSFLWRQRKRSKTSRETFVGTVGLQCACTATNHNRNEITFLEVRNVHHPNIDFYLKRGDILTICLPFRRIQKQKRIDISCN